VTGVRDEQPVVGALDLRIDPEWEAVKAAWDPCRAALSRAGLTDDETYQLAMVAQELLENAVKYGAFAAGEAVLLGIHAAEEEVIVEVKSRVGVDDNHLRRFDRTIQWIRGFQDPFEAYVERMKLVSAQPYSRGESGLGLTRIAYEGRSIIDFYVDEENVLAVSAVYRRDAPGVEWRTP
jgi:anti-sigma regulatory factor (Ser/Thr protein kinase)